MSKAEKQFLSNDAWVAFRSEYEKSDDRSCALLCAAYLDQCLSVLLREALTNTTKLEKDLIGDMRPLGTFSSRISIAHCLNLIPGTFYSDFNTIRKIRNDFAHKLHGLTFSTEPIASRCLSLQTPEDYVDGLDLGVENICGSEPRNRFIFTFAVTAGALEDHYLKRAQLVRQALTELKPAFL